MSSAQIEIWGGVECAFVKVRSGRRDQVAETGHESRSDDLAAVAALGIRTLRYPVLWEKVAPRDLDRCDWGWHDQRLTQMRGLGIRPIAGLLHHGGGPAYTSLLDPEFPEAFARYAGRVARRYPWIDRYTPINEPLTTARFSGLYGHWHPHRRSVRSFLRVLVNQCAGIRLAMAEIRKINPTACLVQTEDIGKAFATSPLRRQADYENQRRWLSLDLLSGRVDAEHPWWPKFLKHGIAASELECFHERTAAPDIIGFDHYLTSERYLDHNLAAYPHHMRPPKGRRAYVDLEATRADFTTADLGPAARLKELWARYSRPIAVTEVHHDGTREEQLRWLAEVWRSAQEAREAGVDVRAMTLWSLFGAVDWNSLLTRKAGYYESGAFDIRAPAPRITAVGRAAKALTQCGTFEHAVLDSPGWWKRSDRFIVRRTSAGSRSGHAERPILIVGESSLAAALRATCEERALAHVSIADAEAVLSSPSKIQQLSPWAVVNAVSDGRSPVGVGAKSLVNLAHLCARFDWPLLAFSSDRVFDGALGRPYEENDAQSPPDAFGRVLASVESRLPQLHARTLIARCGPIFGLDAAASDDRGSNGKGRDRALSADATISPTYAPDLLRVALDLLIDGETGIWHLANPGSIPVGAFAELLGAPGTLAPKSMGLLQSAGNFELTSRRGWIMPTLDSAMSRYLRTRDATSTSESVAA